MTNYLAYLASVSVKNKKSYKTETRKDEKRFKTSLLG
jgi:hypothetical protein